MEEATESGGQEEMDRTTNWLMIFCVRGPRAHADQQINLILSQALDLQHWLGITDPVICSSSKTTLPWMETGGAYTTHLTLTPAPRS